MSPSPTSHVNYQSDSHLFIFAHIPKTAGMTFKGLLDRQFAPHQVQKIVPDYQDSVNRIKALSPQAKGQVRCIRGHIPFGVHRYFDQKTPQYISFVRDPVDRIFSEYYFFAKQPQLLPLIGLDPGTKLSPRDFLDHQISMGLMDFQARILSGHGNMIESVHPPYAEMADTDADVMIQGIIDSFALIGTVERFDESLLLMKHKFGWRNMYYIRRNTASKRPERSQLKQEMGDEIRKLNPLDCQLHARVKSIVDAMIDERGEAFVREVEQYRSRNGWYKVGWSFCRATGLRRLHKIVTKSRNRRERKAAAHISGDLVPAKVKKSSAGLNAGCPVPAGAQTTEENVEPETTAESK
ncbi:MAG: sulfotransferase family 2 domain-containing protein [Planctomycetota bacterium]